MAVEIQVGQDNAPTGERAAINGQASFTGLVFVDEPRSGGPSGAPEGRMFAEKVS